MWKLIISVLFLIFIPVAQAVTFVSTPTELYYPELDTVAGNPSGRVSVVEFFDYRCQYCRSLAGVLTDAAEENKAVRLVYRDYPLLGYPSELAAAAALAAQLQGKYLPFQTELFAAKKPLNAPVISALADQIKLNTQMLDKDSTSDVVMRALNENQKLANSLGVMGIPTVLVAKTPDRMNVLPISAIWLTSPSSSELEYAIAMVDK